MAATADARAAPSCSRVVARGLVHAAPVVGMVALLLHALAGSSWVAAAAPSMLRVAASLLAPQPICFILANGILIALAVLFSRYAASLSPTTFADASGAPSSNSNGDDAPQQNAFLEFLADATRTLTPTPNTEAAEPSVEEVFEDKHAVHVKTTKVRAQPPRRTMSEKTGGVGAAVRTSMATAASTELRRAKSENGRRRQRRSAVAAAPAPAELGTDDAEAFRQVVEAFIAKQQTWFHREESLVIARATGGGGEDVPAIAGAAAAAVAVK